MSAITRPDPLRYGGPKFDRVENDAYFTEAALVLTILPHIARYRGDLWLEPCRGEGAIARLMTADGHRVIATDLIDRGYGEGGVDAFKLQHARGAKRVMSNPPYEDEEHGIECHAELVRHMLALVQPDQGCVVMLLPVEFDTAGGRLDLLGGPPFAFKLTCLWRPIWIPGTRGGGRKTSAWYVWDWTHKGPARALYARRPEIGAAA